MGAATLQSTAAALTAREGQWHPTMVKNAVMRANRLQT
jgi:hypothetical protein